MALALGDDARVELPGAGGIRQGREADRQQRVAGCPSLGLAALDAWIAHGLQGVAGVDVPAEDAVQLIEGGLAGAESSAGQVMLAEGLPQGGDVGSQRRGHVERRGEQRLQELLVQRRRLVLTAGADPGHLGGGPAPPGGEPCGVVVGREQLAVAGQVDDHRGGHAQRGVLEGAGHSTCCRVFAAAAFYQVAVTVVLGDLAEGGDLLSGQPVQPAGRLDQPLRAGLQGQRDPVGAGQHRDDRVGGCQAGVDVLLGHQLPPPPGDDGEVEPDAGAVQVGGQPGDIVEMPRVLVEGDGVPAGDDPQPGSGAHIRSGERRPGFACAVVAGRRTGPGQEVASSGRSGRA